MSETIKQIFDANPIVFNSPDDLMYFGQSPYNPGDDAAMTFNNFSEQFAVNKNVVVLAGTSDQTITGGFSLVVADGGNIQASSGNIIAGSQGNQGDVVIYPPTSGMGIFEIAAADSAAMYQGLLTNTPLSAPQTWALPNNTGTLALTSDIGGPAVLLNPTSTQTINGAGLIVPSIETPILATTPPNSSISTIALGTAYQNTLGYDAVYTVYLDVVSASAAYIMLGIGITNTPSQQILISAFTTVTEVIIPITIYLPNAYYAFLSTSGTINVSISGQIAMPV